MRRAKSNQKHLLFETAGWAGVFLILTAYFLISFSYIAIGPIYSAMNVVGSGLIIVEASKKKDFPVVFLNVVWLSIAIITLF